MTTRHERKLVNGGDAVRSRSSYRCPIDNSRGGRRMEQQERYETLVIGGAQAGLSVGYYLKRQGRSFVILDRNDRIGDSWRARWDSLRLYSPAMRDALPGMPFPAARTSYPTKDAMADY